MPETFTVTVKIEDGEWLTLNKTSGDLRDLSALLSHLSTHYYSVYEDSKASATRHGFGTPSSASPLLSPTEPYRFEHG